MLKLIFALIAVAVAVPAGGLLAGVDRRLTARLQSSIIFTSPITIKTFHFFINYFR